MSNHKYFVDFGAVLLHLKEGRSARRLSWNTKVSFIKLQTPDAHSKMTVPYIYIEYPPSEPYPHGMRCPWAPNQTDLLSEDWVILQ